MNPGLSYDMLPDSLVLARYDDPNAKVPQGFYFDSAGQVVLWSGPCSPSASMTKSQALAMLGGSFDDGTTTDTFYEAAVCTSGQRTRFRQFRCDYYDGIRLVAPDPDGSRALLLAGLLWLSDAQNVDGAVLVSGVAIPGDTANLVELCTTETTRGDLGLCDSITLMSTRVREGPDTRIVVSAPVAVRTLTGTCR